MNEHMKREGVSRYCWINTETGEMVPMVTSLEQVPGKRPVVVCLCGSTRFIEAFRLANLRETLAGRIGCDTESDHDLLLAGELAEVEKARLDELHLRKIDLADEVLVLNVGGYIGQSTRREIAYARLLGKQVRWLEAGFCEEEE